MAAGQYRRQHTVQPSDHCTRLPNSISKPPEAGRHTACSPPPNMITLPIHERALEQGSVFIAQERGSRNSNAAVDPKNSSAPAFARGTEHLRSRKKHMSEPGYSTIPGCQPWAGISSTRLFRTCADQDLHHALALRTGLRRNKRSLESGPTDPIMLGMHDSPRDRYFTWWAGLLPSGIQPKCLSAWKTRSNQRPQTPQSTSTHH